jgi:hypothetical protein
MINHPQDKPRSNDGKVAEEAFIIEGEYEVIGQNSHGSGRQEGAKNPPKGNAAEYYSYTREKRRTPDRRKGAQLFFPIETRINDRRKRSLINIEI